MPNIAIAGLPKITALVLNCSLSPSEKTSVNDVRFRWCSPATAPAARRTASSSMRDGDALRHSVRESAAAPEPLRELAEKLREDEKCGARRR